MCTLIRRDQELIDDKADVQHRRQTPMQKRLVTARNKHRRRRRKEIRRQHHCPLNWPLPQVKVHKKHSMQLLRQLKLNKGGQCRKCREEQPHHSQYIARRRILWRLQHENSRVSKAAEEIRDHTVRYHKRENERTNLGSAPRIVSLILAVQRVEVSVPSIARNDCADERHNKDDRLVLFGLELVLGDERPRRHHDEPREQKHRNGSKENVKERERGDVVVKACTGLDQAREQREQHNEVWLD